MRMRILNCKIGKDRRGKMMLLRLRHELRPLRVDVKLELSSFHASLMNLNETI